MAFDNANNSLEVQMATKMQLILDQPMSDISTGLVNRDFEGDFFKIGDTVAVVKPDINSVHVQVGNPIMPTGNIDATGDSVVGTGASMAEFVEATRRGDALNRGFNIGEEELDTTPNNNDARLRVSDLSFEKVTLRIDKTAKYAFAVSDILEAEGRWNYESGGLDLAAHRIRKAHNLEVAQLLVDNNRVSKIGTAAAPIVISSADDIYEQVMLPIFAGLFDAGAITADGQVTFGSNQSQAKKTFGQVYVPTRIYTELLKSKYLTDRATVSADEKVQTGKVKTILGLDINIEPALAATVTGDRNHIRLANTADGRSVMAIIAGTQNTVTRAGKVLPPEKLRSQTRFADEYHGMEIYGQEVMSPESAVVVYVTFEAPAEQGQS